MRNIEEIIQNATNEMIFVGCIYKNPDLFVEYGHNIRSKYDFYDNATRFFYDNAEILFTTRTQNFSKTSITVYMAEDETRLQAFKRYGGYKVIEDWMQLADLDNFTNYYNVLKKFSLLREYQRNGFNVTKIREHRDFEKFTASDIYRMIRSKADRIHTVILTNEESEILNSHIQQTLIGCMEKPDLGIPLPFPIMSDMTRGMKKKSCMAVGMLSNAGKSRYMTKLIAYVTLVLKEKVLVLLNEMSIEEIRYALITTVINNPEFQDLHGIHLRKNEKELTLGLYRDDVTKEFIYQSYNKDTGEIESIEDFVNRVATSSTEYIKIMKVAKWIEEQTEGLIYTKDISTAYDDKTLEFEIRKAHLTQGIDYVFYDTFKNDLSSMGDWAAMKVTATTITELMKELDMFGYLSIQLTDDANFVKPDELTSSNIANCKGIKHVLHTLFLCKEIPKSDFHKYGYSAATDWGNGIVHELDLEGRYYCFVTDKNRFGDKKKIIFRVDLDKNLWTECGELIRK